MIHFTCPCGKSLQAREQYAGETTRCPDCGRDLVIPAGQGVQASAPTEAPADLPATEERVRRGRPRERDWDESPRPAGTSGMAVGSAILGVAGLFCSVFTAIPAIICGALALRAIASSDGRLQGKGLAITGIIAGALFILLLPAIIMLGMLPAVQKVREAANRAESTNNLKEIDIALVNYADGTGTLPNSAICDQTGKPLLSWRVAILPYVEEEGLYAQFKLDEPWDGPNNARLIAQMPKVYAMPGDSTGPPGYTYYRVFVARRETSGNITTAFAAPQPGMLGGVTQGLHWPAGIPDGTSQTIGVVEAGTSVPWTKPDELIYDPKGPLPPLGGHHGDVYMAAMLDGSVRPISSKVSEPTLRAAITANGGEILGPDW